MGKSSTNGGLSTIYRTKYIFSSTLCLITGGITAHHGPCVLADFKTQLFEGPFDLTESVMGLPKKMRNRYGETRNLLYVIACYYYNRMG